MARGMCHAEVTSSQLPDSCAIEGDPGDLADVEAQRNRGVGVAPGHASALVVRSETASQPVPVFEVNDRFVFTRRAGLAKDKRPGECDDK